MTYDPRHGELSRAMRNRGVELCVEKPLEVTRQICSAALADQSLLRTLVLSDRSREGSASDLANLIVSQPARSVALLERYGRLADTRPAYEATLAFLTSPTMSAYRATSSANSLDVLVSLLLPESYASLTISQSTHHSMPTSKPQPLTPSFLPFSCSCATSPVSRNYRIG